MIGLGVLFIMMVWMSISFSIMFFSTIKIKNKLKRWLLILIIFPLIFIAPVLDEIVGRYQVYQICENSKWYFDEETSKNRDVVYGGMSNKVIDKTIISIEEIKRIFVDKATGEVVIYDISYMHGNGWLIRYLMKKNKNQSDVNACYPKIKKNEIFDKLNINQIKG